jgi:hypothetical protein
LREGGRGLPGGSSLTDLLERDRGVRNRVDVPDLTLAQFLAWADRFPEETGSRPNRDSGRVPGAPGETWDALDSALRVGIRGLKGGDSLPRLLARRRRVCNNADLPRLTPRKVLKWAEYYFNLTGTWPTCESGPVVDARGGTCPAVNLALYREKARGGGAGNGLQGPGRG